MNILNVLSYWGPEFGGPYINMINLAANAIKAGHKADIITTSPQQKTQSGIFPWNINTSSYDIPLTICKSYDTQIRFSKDFKKQFQKIVKKYDIVLIHGLWQYPASYAAYYCRKHNIPYLIFTHAMMSQWAWTQKSLLKNILFRFIEKQNLLHAKRVCYMDQEEHQHAKEKGIHTKEYIFKSALNKTDIQAIKKARDHTPESDTFNILYLGRIHPKKGLHYLVESIHELRKKHQKIHLHVAGPEEDPQYAKKIKDFIAKKNLDTNITFYGTVAGSKKEQLFIDADVFLLPSADESSPVALLEAMGFGIPVIITPGCKIPEVHNTMGYVINRDPSEISNAIDKLITNVPMKKEMENNAHTFILKHFTWESRIQEIIKLLSGII